MVKIGALGFTSPLLLLALVGLPVLWLVLRAVPPAPLRRRFPGVALLLGLSDDETQSDRTPWWLLLLRMLAVAAVILAFSGPVLNPANRAAGSGPLLVLVDATWADADDWAGRLDRIDGILGEAGRANRPVAVVASTDLPEDDLRFQSAEAVRGRLPGLAPRPWEPGAEALSAWLAAVRTPAFDTIWLSDGIDRPGRVPALEALEARGAVRVIEAPRLVAALRPPVYNDGVIDITVLRVRGGPATEVGVTARGPDPTGTKRVLARGIAAFAAGETEAGVSLALPAELRNRVELFAIEGQRSAAAVSLTDDALKRREVAMIAGREDREGLELLSPLHYLEQALAPSADLIGGGLDEILVADPDVIILADVATIAGAEEAALVAWLEDGGLLVRFAGPRVAASDLSRETEHPLMPVRLRAGGRSVGGAMSWGSPKTLRSFDEGSLFHGLDVPEEVTVTAQVLAQPDPTLAERTLAALSDGTPLVTGKSVGTGRVVLFHVTANAEWSSLPLSGLFVQMLDRLAVSTRPSAPDAADLDGTVWQASETLDGFGLRMAAGTLAGVDGADLAGARPGPDMPPGVYVSGDQRLALNVIGPETALSPMIWPARVPVEGLTVPREVQLKGMLLAAALLVLAADVLGTLWLSGKLGLRPRVARTGRVAGAVVLAALLTWPGGPSVAQDSAGLADAEAIAATGEVVLAHVVTGNDSLDSITQAGLAGLSRILFARTAIEPAPPIAVNLETDELAFFPILYWPVTPDQPRPSSEAYTKLNRYLRSGGMILFDTRDGDLGGFGSPTPNARKLQQLARPLDIPPLEPLPSDHVLTRTFYLLQDFPGRYAGAPVWVEAAPPDAEQVDGMPFRNLNDGVTPVVIGGNDWAGAWAMSERGAAMFPVGRGYAGQRQRELAYRFGVNLVMHVLTGNYKSDQVHVPALLDRLGQ